MTGVGPGLRPSSGWLGAASGGARWIRMERRFDTSPERLYRAWTDPEELAAWFPLAVEGSLATGTRSVLVWADRRMAWDVLESEPDRRIRARWQMLPDDPFPSDVTLTIAPMGYGSRLTLEAGPYTFSREGGIEAWGEAREGWAEALAQLRAQLDFSVDLRWIGR